MAHVVIEKYLPFECRSEDPAQQSWEGNHICGCPRGTVKQEDEKDEFIRVDKLL